MDQMDQRHIEDQRINEIRVSMENPEQLYVPNRPAQVPENAPVPEENLALAVHEERVSQKQSMVEAIQENINDAQNLLNEVGAKTKEDAKANKPTFEELVRQRREEENRIEQKDININLNIDAYKEDHDLNRVSHKQKMSKLLAKEAEKLSVEEREAIQANMWNVKDRGFMPVNRPPERIGWWNKAKNRFMVGVRWLVGSTLGVLAAAAGYVISAPYHFATEKKRRKDAQKTTDYTLIPGTKDEHFEEEIIKKNEKGEDESVYSDVRRGPLVWEKLTAGDPEEPPEVVIMMEQATRGKDAAAEGGNMGHAMVGLVYSRYNKRTRKKERYQIRMGFYPAANMTKGAGTLSMVGGAIVGGQLRDDYQHKYDIAKRYQVTNTEINRILRKAETYADGGYGYYKRNCTTFVMDMAKEANLPIAKEAHEEEMMLNGRDEILAEAGSSIAMSAYYGTANEIGDNLTKTDKSYLRFGQKLSTTEDLDRYYKTAINSDAIRRGYAPGTVGEVMRESTEGEISGSYIMQEDLNYLNVSTAITGAYEKLDVAIKEYLKDTWTPLDQEFLDNMNMDDDFGFHSLAFAKKEYTKPERIREMHKEVRTAMKKLSKYHRTRLHNDPKLSLLVIDYMSVCEAILTHLDDFYSTTYRKDMKGDLGVAVYNHYYSDNELNVTGVKRTDAENAPEPVYMPAGLYEGYLKMGKKPEEIVMDCRELEALMNNKDKSSAEKKRFRKLKMERDTAMDFFSASRYLMDKDEFSDKELRYFFRELPKMEKYIDNKEKILTGSMVTQYPPSITYQGVALEKVFEGMKNAVVLEPDYKIPDLTVRFDDYISRKMEEKKGEFERILRIYMEDKQDMDAGTLVTDFMSVFFNVYLLPVYQEQLKHDNDMFVMSVNLGMKGRKTGDWLENAFNRLKGGAQA